jgi:hypothetical protein
VIKLRELPLEKPAKIGFNVGIQRHPENIAMDIIKTDKPGPENPVGVDQLVGVVLEPHNLGVRIPVIHIEKHNPAGGREKEFDFRKRPSEKRLKIKIACRFIMKKAQPEDDKNGNDRISDSEGHPTVLTYGKSFSLKTSAVKISIFVLGSFQASAGRPALWAQRLFKNSSRPQPVSVAT